MILSCVSMYKVRYLAGAGAGARPCSVQRAHRVSPLLTRTCKGLTGTSRYPRSGSCSALLFAARSSSPRSLPADVEDHEEVKEGTEHGPHASERPMMGMVDESTSNKYSCEQLATRDSELMGASVGL